MVIFFKKLVLSLFRILVALAIIFAVAAGVYWLWQPGGKMVSRSDDNAIWLGHGWLGDDAWFARNHRNRDDFRSADNINAILAQLKNNHIHTVYPHLCPADRAGNLAGWDDSQVERFLDAAEAAGVKVIPWVGGVLDESARIADPAWVAGFVTSVETLLQKHPRLAGVQVNIEPLPSGNGDFLRLLDQLRSALGGKILSVAAYPPPTIWHRVPEVHWELAYLRQVAARSDQLAVMMYDTAIPLAKCYTKLMRDWTLELQTAVGGLPCKVYLGLPAYEDAGVGYHHPAVENLVSALAGVRSVPWSKNIAGCAIYSEWVMTPEKWQVWRDGLGVRP